MILVVVNGSDQPCESIWKGRLELNSSYLDASQGTELVLDSIWHSTGSQVTCNWHSRKTWSSAKFARPSPPTAHRFTARPCDRPGGEGLAARLTQQSNHVKEPVKVWTAVATVSTGVTSPRHGPACETWFNLDQYWTPILSQSVCSIKSSYIIVTFPIQIPTCKCGNSLTLTFLFTHQPVRRRILSGHTFHSPHSGTCTCSHSPTEPPPNCHPALPPLLCLRGPPLRPDPPTTSLDREQHATLSACPSFTMDWWWNFGKGQGCMGDVNIFWVEQPHPSSNVRGNYVDLSWRRKLYEYIQQQQTTTTGLT